MPTHDSGQSRSQGRADRQQEDVDETDAHDAPATTERQDKLTEDVDSMLDEIDGVLEENAEEFVRAYVQKGGE
ncbi:MAG: ubiquitin-like protein Pup [Mycobacteriales bacterium]